LSTLDATLAAAPGERSLAWRLYHGETAFDFVGRRRRWFTLSGTVILVGLLALGVKGLNFGIDFRGGTVWEVPAGTASVARARDALRPLGLGDAKVQVVAALQGAARNLRVEARAQSLQLQAKVTDALAKVTGSDATKVSVDAVGPSWGSEISSKAERALVVFLIAIFVFIALRFQWKMALAAVIAVLHDILVTVGVYALFGFPVTPATVIAFLTILGYSLYDTVVVFDKVDENTKGLAGAGRLTYSDTVNLSMNQVLMRSLNTSLVAILPILSVLVVGDVLLGAATLREFGLALFVGLLTGAYSSIFVAAPILAMIKEREPRYVTIRQRIEARGAAGLLLTPAAAAAGALVGGGSGAGGGGARGAAGATGGARGAAGATEGARADAILTPAAAGLSGAPSPRPDPRPRPGGARPGGPRAAPRGRKRGRRR